MQTTHLALLAHRYKLPLVVRGSLPRTFWGLGLFAEASLLFTGIYLFSEAILRPLEASPVSVLAAGVILALATILLFYLISPWRKDSLAQFDDAEVQELPREKTLADFANTLQKRIEANLVLDEKRDTKLPGPM
jgi:type VI protein secretion system component VasK